MTAGRARRAVSPVIAVAFLIVIVLLLAASLLAVSRGLVDIGGDPLVASAYITDTSIKNVVTTDPATGQQQQVTRYIYVIKLSVTAQGESLVVNSITISGYDADGNDISASLTAKVDPPTPTAITSGDTVEFTVLVQSDNAAVSRFEITVSAQDEGGNPLQELVVVEP